MEKGVEWNDSLVKKFAKGFINGYYMSDKECELYIENAELNKKIELIVVDFCKKQKEILEDIFNKL